MTVESLVNFLSSQPVYAPGFAALKKKIAVIILCVQFLTCNSEVCLYALNVIKQ